MKPIIKFLMCLIITSVLLASCGISDSISDSSDKPSVVATNFALYDFARAVCGDECEVTMLISPGQESHDFEATLSDIVKITDSDLFIYVGGESEDWVQDIFTSLDSMGEELNSLCVLDSVGKYDEEVVYGMIHEDDEDSKSKHDHGEPEIDEHVWTSIPNAIQIIEDIRERMCEIDPSLADILNENASAYIDELRIIDSEIEELVNSSENKTIIVADRFPFRYFTERYGLDYYAAFSGCTSDVEPTLDMIDFLIEKVNETGCPVFIIEFSDGTTAKAVQAETGCDILCLHSVHNVTKEDFDSGVTYADLMRQNLESLKKALK